MSSFKEILVDVQHDRTVAAIIEEGSLMELYIEHEKNKRIVGNIYKGIVKDVLPGMQAAFVDIGLDRNSFLYVDEIVDIASNNRVEDTAVFENISCKVTKGQEILVQVTKEPLGTKGARISTKITLPGRFMVLMPTFNYIGVSRRIEDDKERERLKEIAGDIKAKNIGVIVRTAAEGAQYEDLEKDMNMLVNLWEKIYVSAQNVEAPQIVHEDQVLIQRVVRDLLTEDVCKLYTNSLSAKEKLQEYVGIAQPEFQKKILFQEKNLLENYNVIFQINQALRRKVWLKSGAYIVIDQMEALTSIDVNTGRYVGKVNLKETVLSTNMQAAAEIARQLRLRNIGGIIIIDFIDMEDAEDKKSVLDKLENELKKDRTKTAIMGITQLGLVEMTRKKTRKGLESILLHNCPHCSGRGKILDGDNLLQPFS